MSDAIFPPADVLSSIVEYVGSFVAAGVGIAFIGWVLGYVIYFIIDTLRY